MIQSLPTGSVYSVHNNLVKLGSVYAGLTLDTTSCCITTGNCTIVEKKNLGISLQPLLLCSVDRHIGNDSSGRILSEVICFSYGVNLHYVVAVKSSLDDGTSLAETRLASTDLTKRIISFC